jgi:hypothetical protein
LRAAVEHARRAGHGGHLRRGFLRLVGLRGAHAFTRTSYQPAWPVIGSELLMRPPANGSSSEIRWLSRKPLRDSSAPGASCQAPSALPIAFQVHTVPGSTASL